ncbi:MAG TPA: thioredoxin domain-containing protein [Terriglobia bacterium]|nr:thioredoxin domain-containing protein [Terriglobia bacterium]
MPKSKTTPFLVIIVGVLVAGGFAMYLSRQGSTSAGPTEGGSAAAQTGHVRGAPDAMISLVEYGDYQCPTCGLYHPILKELLNRYPGKFKLQYHHFPLVQMHSNAMGAALAAEAAADQGKFWEMHDLLFDRQREWGDLRQPHPNAEAVFVQYALQIGLDSNKFMQSMRSPATRDRVLADVTRGNAVVKGTPTFILDGQVVPNLPPIEWFVDYIERRLATSAQSGK